MSADSHKPQAPQTQPAPVVTISADALAEAFQKGMAAALQSVQPAKPFDRSEYNNRPENQDPADRLKRPVFHHGEPIQIRGCSQATIDNLDALEAGSYLDDDVQVEVKGKFPHEKVYITTPFADRDRRLAFYMKVSSFSDLVAKVVAEQRARTAKK